jgi:hypothetical protein
MNDGTDKQANSLSGERGFYGAAWANLQNEIASRRGHQTRTECFSLAFHSWRCFAHVKR